MCGVTVLGPSHRLTAAAAGAAHTLWVLGDTDPTTVALAAVVATAASAGWSSPDMDQTKPFDVARTLLGPAGKLLAHRRGITHWWFIPAVLWLWWLPAIDPATRWAAAALIVGWSSHIVGDAIFGKVPVTPGYGWMVGLSLRTGGWVEQGSVWTGGLSPLRLVLTAALVLTGWTALSA